MTRPCVYAFVPVLSSQIGHVFHYHASVQRALQLLGWRYSPLVPMSVQIPGMPSHWQAILAHIEPKRERAIFFRLQSLFANFLILRRFLVSLKKDPESVIFVESFDVEHLASLLLAFCLARPTIQVWILHRYVFGKRCLKTVIYRFFHWCYEKQIGKENVRYLTDSELLSQEQQKVYHRSFFVVPIPHAQDVFAITKKQNEELTLWWPGGAIREEKGMKHIRRIAKEIEGTNQIRLVLAEKAKEFLPLHSQLTFISTEISREEYVRWMNQTDLVLLPYSFRDYAHRTSGIFVEAVSLGAIPVVTQGTWMAHELKKFDLDLLAIDWEQENLLDLLWDLWSDQQIKSKLQKMRAVYCAYHSEKNFVDVFAQIINS